MARGVTNNPALEAWIARARQACLLPSGAWVKVQVPDAEALMRLDVMPTELLTVLRQHVTDDVSLEKMDDGDLQRWIEFSRLLAARSVKAITGETSDSFEPPKDGWMDVELTPDLFDELPVEDQQALRLIALRRTTPNTVTAQTLLDQAQIEEAAARRVQDEEAAGTVDGQAEFRPDGEGAQPRDDSANVRPEPSADVPAHRGSGGRARRG